MTKLNTKPKQRGNAIIEFTLMVGWLVFLFISAVDWGFYMYSLISTEAAARVAALYASTSAASATDTSGVCTYALEQLRRMPNIGSGSTTCVNGSSVNSSAPVGISVTSVTGSDGNPAVQVSVTYQTPMLLPMVNALPKLATITRTMQMRMLS